MRVRWGIVMLPAVLLSVGLLVASQFVFLRMSLFRDRGFGLVDTQPTLGNYLRVATDAFYLGSLGLTLEVALIVVACSLIVGYPAAYILTRMNPALGHAHHCGHRRLGAGGRGHQGAGPDRDLQRRRHRQPHAGRPRR